MSLLNSTTTTTASLGRLRVENLYTVQYLDSIKKDIFKSVELFSGVEKSIQPFLQNPNPIGNENSTHCLCSLDENSTVCAAWWCASVRIQSVKSKHNLKLLTMYGTLHTSTHASTSIYLDLKSHKSLSEHFIVI